MHSVKNNLENTSDKVITKIKELIRSGQLKPGDKLPAERKLSQEFGVGRTNIREALHKLEFYGIIKTLPQSGSVINGLDINTLDGMITDILSLQEYDFFSLVETRLILETNTIRLCAERASASDIQNLEIAHANFVENFDSGNRESSDFAFHRTIAEGSHNPVFKALLLVIIPDILKVYRQDGICSPNPNIIDEHKKMLDAIKNRDGDLASELMRNHLKGVVEFAKSKLSEL